MTLVLVVIFHVQNVDLSNVDTNVGKIESGFLIVLNWMEYQDHYEKIHMQKNSKYQENKIIVYLKTDKSPCPRRGEIKGSYIISYS